MPGVRKPQERFTIWTISVSLEDAGCLDFILNRNETPKVTKHSLQNTFNT